MELDKIPGLKKAVAKARAEEDFWRDIAFTDVPLSICGLEVRQFTLRLHNLLSIARSPFLVGGTIGPIDVAGALWAISLENAGGCFPFHAPTRAKFLRRAAKISYGRAVRELHAYFERAYLDAPQGEAGAPPATTCTAAWIIDELLTAYRRMTIDEILDLPLALVFQLLRCIVLRAGGRRQPNKLSDAEERRFVRKMIARNAKRRAAYAARRAAERSAP